jgi:hypothetical protein
MIVRRSTPYRIQQAGGSPAPRRPVPGGEMLYVRCNFDTQHAQVSRNSREIRAILVPPAGFEVPPSGPSLSVWLLNSPIW